MTIKNTPIFRFVLAITLTLSLMPVEAKNRPLTRAEAVPSDDSIELAFPGSRKPVDYKKYGTFSGIGTSKYKYKILNKKGLAEEAGEGVFPNKRVFRNPEFRKANRAGKLKGSHWNFVDTNTAGLNFFRWASTQEDPGIKQFYTAMMLERLGFYEQAIKAFYAGVIHFPRTTATTYYQTPWYVAPAALDRIEQLIRRNPKIKMKLEGSQIRIPGRFDNDRDNDTFEIDPGRLVSVRRRKKQRPVKLKKLKVVETRGGDNVLLKKYENGHWQMMVEGKPFVMRAITYSPTPIGRSPDRQNWNPSKDWQLLDLNKNGIHDALFESFVDKNKNNKQDADEPTVGDAQLLKDLGINTLRAYHHLYDKKLFRRLHKDYGIYVLAGDLLGVYATGSGASWFEGTDYKNPEQRKNMLASVRKMVEEYKDEPYILMWVLGNENVYGVANNSDKDPKTFFSFLNEAAKLIHELDPTRPVGLSNGDLLYLDHIKENCPDVDVFGANVYRGEQGFGRHVFLDVKEALDRPVMITEYGVSAYAEGYTQEQAEAFQSMYLANNWEDLEAHMAGYGEGNALGGVLFEWMDEWWKANSDLPQYVQQNRAAWYATKSKQYKNLQPDKQDLVPQFGLPFLDGWSYEEWLGLVSQGDGSQSPYLRVLRPAYFTLQKMWKKYR